MPQPDATNADIQNWINVLLTYAYDFDNGKGRHFFSSLDIIMNYYPALEEFQKTGDVTSGVGRLVSNLPKKHGTNDLDRDKVTALLDIMVSRGFLRRHVSAFVKQAYEITDAGREQYALQKLRGKENVMSQSAPKVVVITMREDENKAVLKRLAEPGFYQGTHRTYATGKVTHVAKGEYPVAVVRTPEQGPNAAHDTARDAIEDLDPTLIILSGIAGGVPSEDLTLGDVIVPTRLHALAVGAALEGGKTEYANQGGPMTKSVQDLVALIPALEPRLAGWELPENIGVSRPPVDLTDPSKFYGDEDWQKKTKKYLQIHFGPGARSNPKVTTRAMVSTGMLIKDTKKVAEWQPMARDMIGMEMELFGVYGAAQRKNKMYSVLSVRGVSDIVGFKRDDAWTLYAAETAGAFCAALLKRLPDDFV